MTFPSFFIVIACNLLPLSGLCGACSYVCGYAFLNDVIPPDEIGKYSSIASSVSNGGYLLGPIIGGQQA